MRQRRYRKPAVTVALFPFLAVLVCTMGALIVLLVLVVQQARVYATGLTTEPSAPVEEAEDEALLEQEDLVWRRHVLEEQRSELTKTLADRRLQLSHLEDHIRRLEEKWEQLQAAARQLDQLDSKSARQQEQSREELERLRLRLEAARSELQAVRDEVAGRPRTFAVIPYKGPRGTDRRPIYIECRESGIVLQPEGIVLTAKDFDGPLGPGNPLDAALRATREHLAKLNLGDGEPYPLLIVRPDGAIAYNVARQAMKSWDDEFGYELIDAETQLEYPPVDPGLAQLLRKTIEEARQRQSALAMAMPSQFQDDGIQGFVASSQRGGFVPLGSTGTAGGGGFGEGDETRFGGGQQRFSASRTQQGYGRDRGQDGYRQDDPAEFGGTAEGDASPPAPRGGTGSSHEAAGGTGGPQRHGGGGSSMSLSQSRGRNWALPGSQGATTAITRPIAIALYVDRLAILPERDMQSLPHVIAMPEGPLDVIDELVGKIHEHMDGWGVALPGGYWKPVLQVYVTPGAVPQYDELKMLLAGSGFEVEKHIP